MTGDNILSLATRSRFPFAVERFESRLQVVLTLIDLGVFLRLPVGCRVGELFAQSRELAFELMNLLLDLFNLAAARLGLRVGARL